MESNYQPNSYSATANAYKNQQVMTASPEELTLLLYNGALKFANECKKALAEKNFEKSNETNIKAQRIISELSISLDPSNQLSADWARLYEYISYCLVQSNLKRDMGRLDEAIEMIREFRDTWHQAMKTARVK